jgi:hypothetical protein
MRADLMRWSRLLLLVRKAQLSNEAAAQREMLARIQEERERSKWAATWGGEEAP